MRRRRDSEGLVAQRPGAHVHIALRRVRPAARTVREVHPQSVQIAAVRVADAKASAYTVSALVAAQTAHRGGSVGRREIERTRLHGGLAVIDVVCLDLVVDRPALSEQTGTVSRTETPGACTNRAVVAAANVIGAAL